MFVQFPWLEIDGRGSGQREMIGRKSLRAAIPLTARQLPLWRQQQINEYSPFSWFLLISVDPGADVL